MRRARRGGRGLLQRTQTECAAKMLRRERAAGPLGSANAGCEGKVRLTSRSMTERFLGSAAATSWSKRDTSTSGTPGPRRISSHRARPWAGSRMAALVSTSVASSGSSPSSPRSACSPGPDAGGGRARGARPWTRRWALPRARSTRSSSSTSCWVMISKSPANPSAIGCPAVLGSLCRAGAGAAGLDGRGVGASSAVCTSATTRSACSLA